jgi:hypothetical protein
VADIANGAEGTFRLSGRMEGFSGLTPGADYYLSATAGAITATAPANARYVGRADSISSLIITPNPRPTSAATIAAVVDPRIKTLCNGRLSLTTAVPVTTGDVTAATAVKWVPYQGNEVALYSGTAWVTFAQAELSIAVPATTDTVYDLFLNYNAGVPALATQVWNSGTARHAAGIYATLLPTQDGVYVKSTNGTAVDATQRYVGTFRTTGVSGQTEDSFAKRFLWNYYHQKPRQMRVTEAEDSWAYTTATWRQARAQTANQLAFVIGVAEVPLDASVVALVNNSTGNVPVSVAVGLDSTSAPTAGNVGRAEYAQATAVMQAVSRLQVYPAVGYHFAAWLEYSAATGTTTWYGDNGDATLYQAGIWGELLG